MFDLNHVPEYKGNSLLPAGDYRAIIENAEVAKSKAGSTMIKVTFVIDGTKLYDYLILDPKNPKAYHMGLSKAKSILLGIGEKVFNFRNELEIADSLVGELMLEVGIRNEEFNGETREKNFIKRFFAPPVITRPPRPSRTAKDARFDVDSIPF